MVDEKKPEMKRPETRVKEPTVQGPDFDSSEARRKRKEDAANKK